MHLQDKSLDKDHTLMWATYGLHFFGVLGDTVFLSVVLWPFLFYVWAMLALTSVFSLCAENFCFITTLPDVRWGGRKRILSSLCVGG